MKDEKGPGTIQATLCGEQVEECSVVAHFMKDVTPSFLGLSKWLAWPAIFSCTDNVGPTKRRSAALWVK